MVVGLLFFLLPATSVAIENIRPGFSTTWGEVIGLTWKMERGGPYETPDVRFVADNGRTYVFQGVRKPEGYFSARTKLKVSYQISNPQNARSGEFEDTWQFPILLIAFAACLIVGGAFLMVSAIASAKRSISASARLVERVSHFAEAHGFTYPEEDN